MAYKNHKDLVIWKKSMDLAKYTYQLTRFFPKEETYGLKSQMQRSAVSIPSNIAEGNGRDSHSEFDYFLRISTGSAWELSTQFELAYSFGYIREDHVKYADSLIIEITSMIYNLRKSFDLKNRKGSK